MIVKAENIFKAAEAIIKGRNTHNENLTDCLKDQKSNRRHGLRFCLNTSQSP
jgi:hypothetical protein